MASLIRPERMHRSMGTPISFDRVASVYDDTRSLPPDLMEKVIERLKATLERHACRTVLDVGVGTGRFASPVSSMGFDVCGADISAKMLRIARKKSVQDLLLADARTLPFRERSFDASMCVHLLHLILEWERVLSELNRVTRKVFVSVVDLKTGEPGMMSHYEDLLIESGWKEIHPGISERTLPEVRPVLEKEYIARREHQQLADEALVRIERREFSSLFDVPEGLHNQIISKLREIYSGKSITLSSDLYLYVWDARSL